MDFARYAERAADLVNADVDSAEDLRAHLAYRPWLAERVRERDLPVVRRLTRELREIFGRSVAGDEAAVVKRLNELLAEHPVSPFISGHDAQSWHLHVAEKASSVADTLLAETLMGLAVVLCDLGADRFGVCEEPHCDNVFLDTSPNRSRRYCSDRCSSRANVAAYRARQRAATSP